MKAKERTTVINVLGAWVVLAVTACAIVGLIGAVVLEERSDTYYKLLYGAGGTLLILTGAHFSMLTVTKLLALIGSTVYIAGAPPPEDEDDLAE